MTMKTLLAGAAALALSAGAAFAAETTLKFGHVGDPGSLYETTANQFASCVAEKTGSKVEVQVFGSSQLGNDEEMLQKLKLNQIHFSLPSSIMSSVDGKFGVFEMPYIVQDRDHMRRIRDEMGDTFRTAAQEKGYRILGFWENGFRHVTNNVRPVNVPEDLKGIKLRVPKGEWRVKMFQAYNANPTPMAFSEVFTALKTGVIDGQENPLVQIWSGKFPEVQKYLSMTGHVYSPAYVLASDRAFSNLPEDVQTAATECAETAGEFAYEESARLDQELIDKIKEKGVEVNEADKQAFIDASKTIYEEFGEQVEGGSELIEEMQSLAQGS